MYLHYLIDYHDKKYAGGMLLEAETAPESGNYITT